LQNEKTDQPHDKMLSTVDLLCIIHSLFDS